MAPNFIRLSGYSNTTTGGAGGSQKTFIGNCAGAANRTGSRNTSIGSNSPVQSNYSNANAIG